MQMYKQIIVNSNVHNTTHRRTVTQRSQYIAGKQHGAGRETLAQSWRHLFHLHRKWGIIIYVEYIMAFGMKCYDRSQAVWQTPPLAPRSLPGRTLKMALDAFDLAAKIALLREVLADLKRKSAQPDSFEREFDQMASLFIIRITGIATFTMDVFLFL